MPLRFSVERVLDPISVPNLSQPTSLSLDLQGNLVICDRPNGRPTVSRLLAADNYRRQPIADLDTLDAPPVFVRTGPRDTLYVCCFPAEGGQPVVRRLSATGQREQRYPLPGTPSDIAVGHDGKLWVIYRDRSQGLSLQAYGTFGPMAYDYETAVEEARNEEQVPPLFIDGQYLAVAEEGDIWFGAFLERASAIRLSPEGRWLYWDYPTSFDDSRGFVDYCGLAAVDPSTLLTTAFSSDDGGPSEQYVVEIDLRDRKFTWTRLADLGLPHMTEPSEPSIFDLAWHDSRLYLCDYTYDRIIVLQGRRA